jgi:uncharacterized lipoprotein YddW (UPF0748 family)
MKNGDNSVTLDALGSSGGAVVIADAVRFVSSSVTPTPTPTPTPLAGEWRAFWVDAWHSGIFNASEVTDMVNTAANNNYNAVVVQIRRRGDAFYFPTSPNIEPRNSSIAADFDPLQETINQAHTAGLEVHAWLPTFLISSTSAPSNPNHVYNLHPEYLMENNVGEKNISEGYYLDPGNPEANKWNYNVVMDLVAHYNIDGIHFDYIRYPQQNSGYNPTAIARYNAECRTVWKTGLYGSPILCLETPPDHGLAPRHLYGYHCAQTEYESDCIRVCQPQRCLLLPFPGLGKMDAG